MTLREQAEEIWRAGVAAVDSASLVHHTIAVREQTISVGGEIFPLGKIGRILVVGAGKAGAGMAAGLEAALGTELVQAKVIGWVNVPADCVRPLQKIHLHAARPAGVNEPTVEGVQGSEQILKQMASMTDDDLCIVLISGGGSALLPAPIPGITLEDKLAVTRFLMKSGATIQELNTVRKRLSRIKGGGLLRSAKAGRMIALIISDVPGDPLDIIASGPTVCDTGTARDALQVLERFTNREARDSSIPASIWRVLDQQILRDASRNRHSTTGSHPDVKTQRLIPYQNRVIGNNQTALDAAAARALALGFEVRQLGTNRQGIAREIGVELAELCLAARDDTHASKVCFIAGGEPTVKLAPTELPRKGGRNQEVALSAGCRWKNEDIRHLVVLSGGTDGEDGPTDAAGAFFDVSVQQKARELGLRPDDFLAINDSYTFFEETGGLLKTGPTHTNVMDLQIALVAGREE